MLLTSENELICLFEPEQELLIKRLTVSYNVLQGISDADIEKLAEQQTGWMVISMEAFAFMRDMALECSLLKITQDLGDEDGQDTTKH